MVCAATPHLEAALEYARQGYKVFPLRVGLKKPLGGLAKRGVLDATSDADTIRRWFSHEPWANIGLACEGLVVIDCDPGNDWAEFERLKAEAAYSVQNTPSGGLHFVFRRPEGKAWANSQSRLANKIDTRTDGGYIVVEPSRTLDSPVEKTVQGDYFFETPLPSIEELPYPPDWLVAELDAAFAPKHIDVPQPASPGGSDEIDLTERAIAYLAACPPAISGQNGHNQTFAVTQALVHGFCLKPEATVQLLREHYNPRCEPPWSEKELQHKVDSALKNPPGKPRGWLRDQQLTAAAYPDVDLSKFRLPPQDQATDVSGAAAENRKLILTRADQIQIHPPGWLLRGILERDTFALVFGDPGCGKSFLAIDWAARIATGTPWREHPVQAGTVIYVAGEGHNGLGRRFRAWQEHHDVSIEGAPLFVAPAVPIPHGPASLELIDAIDQGERPDLIVIDTLARSFGGGDENSTQDMSKFVSACDALRRRYGCTLLLVHHTGHGEKTRARGAMALKAALDAEFRLDRADSGLTLTATKMKDAETPSPLAMELVGVDLPDMTDDYGNPVSSAAVEVFDADTSALVSKTNVEAKRSQLDADRNEVMEIAAKGVATKRSMRDAATCGRRRFDAAFDSLVADGALKSTQLVRGNKHTYEAWTLPE